MNDDYYDVISAEQAAEIMKCSVSHIRELANFVKGKPQLPSFRVGKNYAFHRGKVENYFQQFYIHPSQRKILSSPIVEEPSPLVLDGEQHLTIDEQRLFNDALRSSAKVVAVGVPMEERNAAHPHLCPCPDCSAQRYVEASDRVKGRNAQSGFDEVKIMEAQICRIGDYPYPLVRAGRGHPGYHDRTVLKINREEHDFYLLCPQSQIGEDFFVGKIPLEECVEYQSQRDWQGAIDLVDDLGNDMAHFDPVDLNQFLIKSKARVHVRSGHEDKPFYIIDVEGNPK